jgi:hypothetical protein
LREKIIIFELRHRESYQGYYKKAYLSGGNVGYPDNPVAGSCVKNTGLVAMGRAWRENVLFFIRLKAFRGA